MTDVVEVVDITENNNKEEIKEEPPTADGGVIRRVPEHPSSIKEDIKEEEIKEAVKQDIKENRLKKIYKKT